MGARAQSPKTPGPADVADGPPFFRGRPAFTPQTVARTVLCFHCASALEPGKYSHTRWTPWSVFQDGSLVGLFPRRASRREHLRPRIVLLAMAAPVLGSRCGQRDGAWLIIEHPGLRPPRTPLPFRFRHALVRLFRPVRRMGVL